MRRLSGILAGGLLVALTAGPAFGQASSWQQKWFWGAQSGVLFYSTPAGGTDAAFMAGPHWLITATRSALYIGLDQMWFPASNSSVSDGTAPNGQRTVTFDSGRRLQGMLLAIPIDGSLQVWVGGGIAIHQITDAEAVGTTDQAVIDRVEQAATRAFAVGSVGIQLRFGSRWAFYGSYQYMPSSNKFLIRSVQHALSAGLRVALGASHEEVTTQR